MVQAAERVMTSSGYSALKVDALVQEVGTTRPTFYRRFPNVAHLAFEVIRTKFGTGTQVDSGSLYGDLAEMQRLEIAMFSSPLMRNNLPGLLEAVRTDKAISNLYRTGFVEPRRQNVGEVISAAVSRSEVDDNPIDLELVCDLLTGPILARALLPLSAPIDDHLARQTATIAYRFIVNP